MQTTLSSTQVWFDLEGIKVDGLGYTVTISGGNTFGRRKHKHRLKSSTSGLRSRSRLTRHESSSNLDDSNMHCSARAGIVTKTSVEVRESYHEPTPDEEIQIWNTGDECYEDSDLVNEQWENMTQWQSHPDCGTSGSHQEEMGGSLVPSSDAVYPLAAKSQAIVAEKEISIAPETPSSLSNRRVSHQSPVSARLNSRPPSRERSPAITPNSSQAWVALTSPRTRLSTEPASLEQDII